MHYIICDTIFKRICHDKEVIYIIDSVFNKKKYANKINFGMIKQINLVYLKST